MDAVAAVAGVGAATSAMAAAAAAASPVVVVVSGIVCAAVAAVLSDEAIAVAPLDFWSPEMGELGFMCGIARRARDKMQEWLKVEEGAQRWLFYAVAPRFVPRNGQVRDFRHASAICAT